MSAATAVAKTPNHEEIFLARYDQLLKWASQLTKPDRELARDLVHEAYLQFSSSAGDLLAINNIDHYLYGVVRNTYLTHLRRSPLRFQQTLEPDSTETLALTIDPRDQIKAKDELIAICHQACVRKETSVAASLLILRFFHGYLPSEIAKLTQRTRNVVDVQLKLARWEAVSAGEKRRSFQRIVNRSLLRVGSNSREPSGDFVTELRQEIFSTRKGECISKEQLSTLHVVGRPISRSKLSHLVSCHRCLDDANRSLGLPLIKERNVLDLLGRATKSVRVAQVYSVRKTLCLMTTWSLGAGLNAWLS